MSITFSLPHDPSRWRRVGASVWPPGRGGLRRTVVSTPGNGFHEEAADQAATLAVLLEGDRRHGGGGARAEAVVVVTGDVTDQVTLRLDEQGPVLRIGGVRRVSDDGGPVSG